MNVELLTAKEARERFPADHPWLNQREKLLVVDGVMWGKSAVSRVRGGTRHRIWPKGAWVPLKPFVESAQLLPFLVRDLIKSGELPEAVAKIERVEEARKKMVREAAEAEAELWRAKAREVIRPILLLTPEERELLVIRIIEAMKWSRTQ